MLFTCKKPAVLLTRVCGTSVADLDLQIAALMHHAWAQLIIDQLTQQTPGTATPCTQHIYEPLYKCFFQKYSANLNLNRYRERHSRA